LTLFSSAALHGASPAAASTGVGADLIGLSGALFFPLFTGRGGGGMTKRRSSTTGAAVGAMTVATETVCDFSSTVRVVFPTFEGNGRPGAFFTGIDFLAGTFFAGAFLAGAFLAGAFLAAIFFAGAFLATAFLAGAFLATAFLAGAFFAIFLPGTPRTLCVFHRVTNFATHGLDFGQKYLARKVR